MRRVEAVYAEVEGMVKRCRSGGGAEELVGGLTLVVGRWDSPPGLCCVRTELDTTLVHVGPVGEAAGNDRNETRLFSVVAARDEDVQQSGRLARPPDRFPTHGRTRRCRHRLSQYPRTFFSFSLSSLPGIRSDY